MSGSGVAFGGVGLVFGTGASLSPILIEPWPRGRIERRAITGIESGENALHRISIGGVCRNHRQMLPPKVKKPTGEVLDIRRFSHD
jgi:hypothetical protein